MTIPKQSSPASLHLDEMMRSKPPTVLLALILSAHLIITGLTWQDLHQRPVNQVYGNKRMWRIASGLNTVGSLAYLLVGRRH